MTALSMMLKCLKCLKAQHIYSGKEIDIILYIGSIEVKKVELSHVHGC